MINQLDLFGTAAPSPARRPARPDTALLLAMSADHIAAPAATITVALHRSPLALAAQSFGAKGKRAWFWQDGAWQVGTAWEIEPDGRVNGRCRDYGPWGSRYAGSQPMETHGRWPQNEVRWKRPADQYVGPVQL